MTRRLVGLTIIIVVLFGAVGFTQDKISLLSDYYMKRDLQRYEEIKKETDVQKRAGLLIEFLKERPVNKIYPYILPDYQGDIKSLLDKKEWDKAITMAGNLQTALPSEAAVKKLVDSGDITVVENNVQEFLQQIASVRTTMQQDVFSAQYSAGNWAEAAKIQEQLYAATPNLQGLQRLAEIYQKMQNTDKYLEVAQKIMSQAPITQPVGFSTTYQVLQMRLQKNDIAGAVELYGKLMDAYGDKTPEGVDAAAWNKERTTAYLQLGQDMYTKKDYKKSLDFFEKAVKADPRNGDAYYFIGMCKWQLEGQDGAVEPLARSVVLNGNNTAARARQNLEQIHKAKNNDSLDGLDEILANAKAGLGI